MILHLIGSSIRRDSGNQGKNSDKYLLPAALSPLLRGPLSRPDEGQWYRQHCDHTEHSVEDSRGSMQYPRRITRSESCDLRLPGFKSQLGHWFAVCFFTCLSPSFLKHQKRIYLTGLLGRLSEPKYMPSIR